MRCPCSRVNVDDDLDQGIINALQKFDASSLMEYATRLTSLVGVETIPTIVLLDSNGVKRYRDWLFATPFWVETDDGGGSKCNWHRLKICMDWYLKQLKDVCTTVNCGGFLTNRNSRHHRLIGWLRGTNSDDRHR